MKDLAVFLRGFTLVLVFNSTHALPLDQDPQHAQAIGWRFQALGKQRFSTWEATMPLVLAGLDRSTDSGNTYETLFPFGIGDLVFYAVFTNGKQFDEAASCWVDGVGSDVTMFGYRMSGKRKRLFVVRLLPAKGVKAVGSPLTAFLKFKEYQPASAAEAAKIVWNGSRDLAWYSINEEQMPGNRYRMSFRGLLADGTNGPEEQSDFVGRPRVFPVSKAERDYLAKKGWR